MSPTNGRHVTTALKPHASESELSETSLLRSPLLEEIERETGHFLPGRNIGFSVLCSVRVLDSGSSRSDVPGS